jgi:excinuclease ABC subunit C
VGLQLLQQIRDEAHRFAITYHRNLRGKRMTTSALDEIPGLGPSRQDSLLKQFSSVPKLCKASIEEIAGVPGISQKLARVIYSHFHPS